MLAPLEWLREFVEVPANTKEFCDAMTLSGSKVETVTKIGEGITNVVTGKILQIEQHPDADRLVVCQVDIAAEKMLQIVTAATNVFVGAIVPVSLHGATLAGGLKIKAGKLRGVDSQGMFCSIHELDLSKESFPEAADDGIFILSPETPPGVDIFKALAWEGETVEFEITSNRPDCFSIYGLAREAAVTFNKPLQKYEAKVKALGKKSTASALVVENREPQACLRYCARFVENVKIAPSPQWLRRRLTLAGIRPINNIVDITNYVMLELGQPMHAFSAETIAGGKIIIRKAVPGEKFQTLDENEHELSEKMLVIADEQKAIALAGVMGGLNSEIHPSSSTIIFEAATFDAAVVREATSALNIRTESSARFERIADEKMPLLAIERACALVEELSCGDVAPDYIDLYPNPKSNLELILCPVKLERFLGVSVSATEVERIFHGIGANICFADGHWTVTVPSFRPDLEGFADLAEEVARFYDYNNIPATLLPAAETTVGGRSLEHEMRRHLRALFVAEGFYEAYTYSFMSPKEIERLGLTKESALAKTVNIRRAAEDTSCLRTTGLPAMFEAVRTNSSRSMESAKLFEIVRTYLASDNIIEELPKEEAVLTAATYSLNEKKDAGTQFYFLKHIVEEVLQQFGIKNFRLEAFSNVDPEALPSDACCYHPYRSAVLFFGKEAVGVFGYVHPRLCTEYEMPRFTAALTLKWAKVCAHSNLQKKQKPLPKFPAVTRDLAFVVNRDIPVGELEKLLAKIGGNLLEEIKLFDVYQGTTIAEDKKSVAYALTFRSDKGTLQDQEIKPLLDKMIQTLSEKLGASLRA